MVSKIMHTILGYNTKIMYSLSVHVHYWHIIWKEIIWGHACFYYSKKKKFNILFLVLLETSFLWIWRFDCNHLVNFLAFTFSLYLHVSNRILRSERHCWKYLVTVCENWTLIVCNCVPCHSCFVVKYKYYRTIWLDCLV